MKCAQARAMMHMVLVVINISCLEWFCGHVDAIDMDMLAGSVDIEEAKESKRKRRRISFHCRGRESVSYQLSALLCIH